VIASTTPVIAQPTPVASSDPAASSTSYTAKGEADFKAGNYAAAIQAWKHALVDDQQNPVLMMMLGQAFFATGKFEEAAAGTQMAMQQLPKEQWGVVVGNYKELYGNAQDYTDQLRALEKAVKEKPDNPMTRFLLGYHYAYLGFPKESVDQLDKGLKIMPQDEGAKQLREVMRAKLPKPVAPPAAAPATPETPSALDARVQRATLRLAA
jgi:tetratricopeptide (TPR) repeat protein